MPFLDLREPVSAWSHGAGMLLAVPGVIWLWTLSRPDRRKQLSILIYGLGLVACFGASALYHGAWGPPGRIAWLATLDHVGIYVLIAGTYTPIAWNLLAGRWRRWTLTLTWLSAAAGVVLQLAFRSLPTSLATVLYLLMGWGAIFCYCEIARAVTHRAMLPILIGGLLYSIGAILNLSGWPVVIRGAFEAHEVFHFFVLAGSLAHFGFMAAVVAPERVALPLQIGEVPPARPLGLRLRRDGRERVGAGPKPNLSLAFLRRPVP